MAIIAGLGYGMNEQDIQEAIERMRFQKTDDEYVEVKSSEQQLSKDVWESVSAFANTAGGTILLGIDENAGFEPLKHFAIDKVFDQFVTGMGDGGQLGARIVNPPTYHVHRMPFEGFPVLAIEIEELPPDGKPCYIAGRGIVGGSYKRVGDKDIRLSPTEIYSLENYLKPSTADRESACAATLDDLQSEPLNELLNRLKDAKVLRGAESREDKLARLNIIDEAGNVTTAGLLVFGKYPQQFFPKLIVDVAVHPGVQKSDPTSAMRFLDRALCDGPVGEIIDDAFHAITKNLRTYSIVSGTGRVDELEIPGEVLREALANAVVHREYGDYFKGQAISVDIYPDRVEIANPGGLWGGKTLENIGDGISACRNAALMKLMSLMPLPSGVGLPTEGNGSGIPLMKSAMASRALSEPTFVAKFDGFKVVLGRGGIEIEDNKRWLDTAVSHELDSHAQAVAIALRRDGRGSVASIRGQLGIDSDEIRTIFQTLVDDRVLRWVGKDEVEIIRKPKWSREEWYKRILDLLDTEDPKGIQEIAVALDRSSANTRTYIKELIERGDVVATAPASSKHRKYLLKRS